MLPNSGVYLSNEDKKWVLEVSKSNPRKLVKNLFACLMKSDELLTYSLAEDLNRRNENLQKAILRKATYVEYARFLQLFTIEFMISDCNKIMIFMFCRFYTVRNQTGSVSLDI